MFDLHQIWKHLDVDQMQRTIGLEVHGSATAAPHQSFPFPLLFSSQTIVLLYNVLKLLQEGVIT